MQMEGKSGGGLGMRLGNCHVPLYVRSQTASGNHAVASGCIKYILSVFIVTLHNIT